MSTSFWLTTPILWDILAREGGCVGWSLSQPFGSEIGNIFGNFIKMVKIRPSWAMAVCHLELYFFFTSPYNWSYNHIHPSTYSILEKVVFWPPLLSPSFWLTTPIFWAILARVWGCVGWSLSQPFFTSPYNWSYNHIHPWPPLIMQIILYFVMNTTAVRTPLGIDHLAWPITSYPC